MPKPDKAKVDALATFLETMIDRAALAKPNLPAGSALHRLNRAEYRQCGIRDLLGSSISTREQFPRRPTDAKFRFR